jgi:hypothetical protein
LLHLGAHVAGVYPVHTIFRVFGGENGRKLLQRCLAGAIATPSFISLHSRIAAYANDTSFRIQFILHRLQERERRNHVDTVHIRQHVQWIIQQFWLRARAKDTGVINHRIQATGRPRRHSQCLPMSGIGNVTGNGRYGRYGR